MAEWQPTGKQVVNLQVLTSEDGAPTIYQDNGEIAQQVRLLGADGSDFGAALANSLNIQPGTVITNFKMGRCLTPAAQQAEFTVNFDLGGAVVPVSVALYSNPERTNLVAVANDVTPVITFGVNSLGDNSTYRTYKVRFPGLEAYTMYYGDVLTGGSWARVAGERGFEIRTFPIKGQQRSFRYIHVSCGDNYVTTRPSRIYEAMGADVPLFILWNGDFGYPDLTINDVRVCRTYGVRRMLSHPLMAKLLRKIPLVWMWDDHDGPANNGHYDQVYTTGATMEQLMANARVVYDELIPHYDYGIANTIAQVFYCGKTKFIMPDTRSWRRFMVGEQTMLGTGTNPPASPNQRQWFLNAIDASSGEADVNFCVFVCSTSWGDQYAGGFPKLSPGEATLIADRIALCTKPFVVNTGEIHMGAFSDGVIGDYATKKNSRIPEWDSSPVDKVGGTSIAGGPFTVNGVKTHYENIGNIFCSNDIVDNGTHVSWVATMKTTPDSGSFGRVLGSMSSNANAPYVARLPGNGTWLSPQQLSLTIQKNGFGPYTACSVRVVIPEIAFDQRVNFLPNSISTLIPANAGAQPSLTVTISEPIGCTLDMAHVTSTVNIVADIAVQTADYVSQFAVFPGSPRTTLYDTMIKALISNNLWDRMVFGYVVGQTQQGFSLNMKQPIATPFFLANGGGSTFLADRYLSGDGTNWFQTPYAFNQMSFENHCYGIWTVSETTNTNMYDIGGDNGYTMNPRRTSTTARHRSANSTSSDTPATTSLGFFLINRRDLSFYDFVRNGVKLGEGVTDANTSNASNPCCLGGVPGSPSTRRFAAAFMFRQSLTQAETGVLYSIVNTYLTAIGAV